LGGCVGGVALVCLTIIGVVYYRKRHLTNEKLIKELELRKLDESFIDDMMANSTQYQKIPGISLSSAALKETLGEGEGGMNWEIKMSDLLIEKEIGRGAYGIVFKARWREEAVAVKKIIGDADISDELVKAFTAEIKLMKNLRPHRAIVTMLGVVTDPLCIVTQFYENGSLLALLLSETKLSMEMNMKFVKGVASGMLHLHSEKIIHRDLAARNILLDKDFEPVIADFGLSRVVQGNNSKQATKSDVGPIKWMAPESLTNKVYSIKTDVWSFGVLCWEILARSEPFPDLEPLEVAFQVARDGLRLEIPAHCPPNLRSIILACWYDDPHHRPDFSLLVPQLNEVYDSL